MQDTVIDRLRQNADALCRKYSVKRIGVFGSCARGEATANSDVDILVEFTNPTFDNYMDLKFALEDLLGRRVDLVTVAALKPMLKDQILREVQYAA